MSGASGHPPRTARKYRAPGPDPFLGPVPGGGPLDTCITSLECLRATAANAGRIHGVDAEHVIDTMRLTMQRGEPVRALDVYDTAKALAASGYAIAPPANDVENWPTPRVAVTYTCSAR